jgi:hypothetical protein
MGGIGLLADKLHYVQVKLNAVTCVGHQKTVSLPRKVGFDGRLGKIIGLIDKLRLLNRWCNANCAWNRKPMPLSRNQLSLDRHGRKVPLF